jgi:S-DNA-T family DNA segregation ATPase FtsK/SpoIIIE
LLHLFKNQAKDFHKGAADMATTQKKKPAGSEKPRQTPKKSTSSRGGQKPEPGSPWGRLGGGVFCFLLAVFVILGLFGVDAVFVNLLSDTVTGLFGYAFWFLAPMLLLCSYLLFFRQKERIAMRLWCALLLPVLLSGMLHVLLVGTPYETTWAGVKYLWSDGQNFASGGVISGFTAVVLTELFSKFGAGLILFLATALLILAAFHITPEAMVKAFRIAYMKNQERKAREAEARYEDEEDWDEWDEEEAPPAPVPPPPLPRRGKRATLDIPLDQEVPPLEESEAFGHAQNKVVEPQGAPADLPQSRKEPVAAPAGEAEPPAERELSKSERKEVIRGHLETVARDIAGSMKQAPGEYRFPPVDLLQKTTQVSGGQVQEELSSIQKRLSDTILSFGIEAKIVGVVRGPSITRYEVELEQGVRLNRLTNLSDDIALALGAASVRIAPVPGKVSLVGIEVPNQKISAVSIREVLSSRDFTEHSSKVAFAVGKDIGGNYIIGDAARLPHMLIAGTTGSGKSVCTNSLIISMLYKATPEEVRLIMVDPKMVELGIYNGIPHLLIPVVTDPKKAAGALQWAVTEMMKRYRMFSEAGVRELASYNTYVEKHPELTKLPQIVIVIDELADLMLVAAKEVEESICRVAQMGRAAGMHLIIATQRPSADVITGLMKANIPSRIAFAVASSLESRIILDTQGAEKLVGKGDMLWFPLGSGKPLRVQGCLIDDKEVASVVSFVKESGSAVYDESVLREIEEHAQEHGKGGRGQSGNGSGATSEDTDEGCDELYAAAVDIVLDLGQASVSMLQRRLKLGYARAARLVDQMEDRGIVGPFEGSKPRQLLINKEQWAVLQGRQPEPEDGPDESGEDDTLEFQREDVEGETPPWEDE